MDWALIMIKFGCACENNRNDYDLIKPGPTKLCAVGGIPNMTENDQMKVLEHRIHVYVKMNHFGVNMDWAGIQQPSPGPPF